MEHLAPAQCAPPIRRAGSCKVTGGGVVGVDHVQVAAPPGCEAEARRFYGEILGLEEISKPERLEPRGGCWFRVGPHELHVGVTSPFTPAGKAHPGLAVESAVALRGLADRLQGAGLPVEWADETEIPGRLRLHTEDPWGNRIELLTVAQSAPSLPARPS